MPTVQVWLRSKSLTSLKILLSEGNKFSTQCSLPMNACKVKVKEGVPHILCKLDIRKVKDHENWDFLYNMLGRYGFGEFTEMLKQ